jgi:hypothetical protein
MMLNTEHVRGFWCNVLAAPILLAVGAWALVTGLSVAG